MPNPVDLMAQLEVLRAENAKIKSQMAVLETQAKVYCVEKLAKFVGRDGKSVETRVVEFHGNHAPFSMGKGKLETIKVCLDDALSLLAKPLPFDSKNIS